MGTLEYDMGLLSFPIRFQIAEFRGVGVQQSHSFILWIDPLCTECFVRFWLQYTVSTCIDHGSPPCDRDRIEISQLSSCTWLLVAFLSTCPERITAL